MELCSDEGFLQSLIKIEQELRAIWNQLTANVMDWCENTTLLSDKIELLTALQVRSLSTSRS